MMEDDRAKKPSSFLAEIKVLSLVAALYFACFYGGFAAYNNLRDDSAPPPFQAPTWLVQRYVVTGEDAVDAVDAVERGQMWCSAPQAAAAATALVLLAVRRGRGGGPLLRALACVALAACAANHVLYLRLLGVFRVARPGSLILAAETASIVVFAVPLDLLGFLAFLLAGGDAE